MAVTLKMWAPVRKCPSLCLWARAETVAPTEDRINTGVLEEWTALRGLCPETSEYERDSLKTKKALNSFV